MNSISASAASPILRTLARKHPVIAAELCTMSVDEARTLLWTAFFTLPEAQQAVGIDPESEEILPIAPKLVSMLMLDPYGALAPDALELNAGQSDKWDEISAAVLAPEPTSPVVAA